MLSKRTIGAILFAAIVVASLGAALDAADGADTGSAGPTIYSMKFNSADDTYLDGTKYFITVSMNDTVPFYSSSFLGKNHILYNAKSDVKTEYRLTLNGDELAKVYGEVTLKLLDYTCSSKSFVYHINLVSNGTDYNSGTDRQEYCLTENLEDFTSLLKGYSWNTKMDGSGEEIDSITEDVYGVNNYKLTLYAQNKLPTECSVTFVNEDTTTVTKVAYGEAVSIPADPVKEGYDFIGWYLDDEEYDFSKPVTRDLTLTAKFVISEYIVSFDENLIVKNGETTLNSGDKVPYGTKLAVSAVGKTGYTAVVKADGAAIGSEYTVTKDVEFTVEYIVNEYTISFDTDGGSAIDPITQDYGTTVVAPADPVKEGYTFAGWEPVLPETMPAMDMAVKAKWTPIMLKVTFDADGTKTEQVVQYGKAVAKPEDPVKEGYTFVAWYLDDGVYDFDTPVTGDITLTAHFVKVVVKHTVTFDVDGDKTTAEVEDGKAVAKPEDPVKEGYTFVAWYFNGKPYDFSTPATMDLTLVAMFSPVVSPSGSAEVRTSGEDAEFIMPSTGDVVVIGSSETGEWRITVPSEFDGKLIKVVVKQVDVSMFSPEIRKKIGSMPVYQLLLYSDGEQITTFPEKIHVKLAYTISAGQNPDDIRLCFIDEGSNSLHIVDSKFVSVRGEEGYVEMDVDHFSYWTFTMLEEQAAVSYDSLIISLVIVLIIATAAVLGSYLVSIRKKA